MPDDKTSFLAALREKYCEDDDAEACSSNGFVSITVYGGKSKRGRQGEVVGPSGADDGRGAGETRPSRPELAHLKHVVLENRGINRAAIPSTGLSSLCPNVLELDLSVNALTSWSEVLTILRHLPLLRFVNLSSNPLQNLEIDKSDVIPCNIRDLVLNNTKVSWREVAALSLLMPQLEQLHLCKNDYIEIPLTAEDLCASLPCVRVLTLNNNYIKRWDEVSKLRLLPKLQTLVLLENPLEDVYYKQTNPPETAASPEQMETGPEANPSEEASSGVEEAEIGDPKGSNIKDSPEPPRPAEASLTKPGASQDIKDAEEPPKPTKASLTEPETPQGAKDTDTEERKSTGVTQLTTEPADPGTTPQETQSLSGDAESLSKSQRGCEVAPGSTQVPGDEGQRAASGTEADAQTVFVALQSLCLTSTALSDWPHLHELSRFPSLTSVKLKSIPLLENWEEKERRKVAVACLPNVKTLNGSEVTPTERDKAERHFVRLFHDQENPPVRHSELVQKHGKLAPLVQVDINKGFKEFTELTFIYQGRCIKQENIRTAKSISELRKHCGKLIDQEPSSVKLYLKTQDPDTQEWNMEELFLDSLPMSRFDTPEGSEIHIDFDENAQNFWWKSAVKMAP